MSTAYKIANTNDVYFLTFQIVGWVDIFTRQAYRDVVIESFNFCQIKKGLVLFAYVIMSNHIHILAQAENGNLSDIVRDFKNYTSSQFLAILNNGKESRSDWMKLVFEYHGKFKTKQINQIWTHENHAEIIYSQKFIEQKVNYIHNNPVRAQIVSKPEDYIYSSARNYANLESILNITKVDFLW